MTIISSRDSKAWLIAFPCGLVRRDRLKTEAVSSYCQMTMGINLRIILYSRNLRPSLSALDPRMCNQFSRVRTTSRPWSKTSTHSRQTFLKTTRMPVVPHSLVASEIETALTAASKASRTKQCLIWQVRLAVEQMHASRKLELHMTRIDRSHARLLTSILRGVETTNLWTTHSWMTTSLTCRIVTS